MMCLIFSQVTPFNENATMDHITVVNAVRNADHIDASMGLINKGIPSSHISEVMAAIPEAGFHLTLLNFVPRIRGWAPSDLWGGLKELATIIKY